MSLLLLLKGGGGESETPPSQITAARVVSEPVDDRLFWELRDASGKRTRWAADEPDVSGVPSDGSFSNSGPGGHRDAGCTLRRDPRLEWPDLNLVDEVVVYGRTKPLGRNAFEGQLDHFPSNFGDDVSIGINAVGNQVLLDEDETWRAVYVALGFEHWGEAPLARRLRNAELGRPQGRIPVSTGDSGLVWDPPNETLQANEVTEAHFQLPAGLKASRLGYRGQRKGSWTNFEEPLILANDLEDFKEGGENTKLTLDNTARTVALPKAFRYLMLRALVASGHTPLAGVQQSFDRLAVYGDSGVPLQEIPGELPGVYGHDAIANILATGAPELNYTVGDNGTIIPNTDFAIPDLAFLTPGKPSEAILKVNAYFLNNWAVWDDKAFHWHPWDPNRLTWKCRIEGGAHWAPAGHQAGTLLNGMVVVSNDIQGRQRTAGPPESGCDVESELLIDRDQRNPYTRRGRRRWGVLTVDFPLAYDSTAVQVGHVRLLEHKLPQRSGTLIIRPLGPGHIPQIEHPTIGPVPTWAMRGGDFAELVGWPDAEPFRVIEPRYDEETKTLTAQLDNASSRMSAILERVGVRLTGIV